MAITLTIPGRPVVPPAAGAATRGGPGLAENANVTGLLDDVSVVHAYSLSPSDRAAAAVEPQRVSVEDDDIIEIEADGVTLWTSAAKYQETARALRSDAVGDETTVVDALPNVDSTTRGGGQATSVRILQLKTSLESRLSEPDIKVAFFEDFGLELITDAGSWVLAKAVTWLIERQLRPQEGLYTWADATRTPGAGGLDPVPASFAGIDEDQPILLFLHGTASSTRGSFGEFLSQDAVDQWQQLRKAFKDRIYAFEHKTLSRSPIENAIAVARQLPARAKLYLTSHSRGGMVGDLLCLGAIGEDQIGAFSRQGSSEEADEYDRKKLRELNGLLVAKQFRIQRFARAACPARGTLLASENLDQFLSIITNLIGLIPFLQASPVYEVIKRITLETVHRRWEPGVLPGLEAMTPASPLVRLLNRVTGTVAGSLGVVAGDIQGGGLLQRLGVFITDRMLYENRDNDLVVNTDSMFQGASHKTARYVFDKGADVSHFNYFKNRRTRQRVAQWLTAIDETTLTEFRSLDEAKIAPVPMARGLARVADAARPVVVLVPDVMGSDIWAGSRRIWLDFDALSDGSFDKLADLGPGVETRSIIEDHYGELRSYLSSAFDVRPFAYDWRRSTEESASGLAVFLNKILDETRKPIAILAHGAGGLVVRQLMASEAEAQKTAWLNFSARAGRRIVLLGTPHTGTYDAVELLLGTHSLVQQLALLNPKLNIGGVRAIFQSFPGILELLPLDEKADFFNRNTWTRLTGLRPGAPLWQETLLATAKAVATRLDVGHLQADLVTNVVGRATRTVSGVRLLDRRISLEVTTDGDGSVTYESGCPPHVTSWIMQAAHGALASDSGGFPAIVDLLQDGDTRRLSVRTAGGSFDVQPRRWTPPEQVLYPTATDLMTAALGRRAPRPYHPDEPIGFRVSVVHGDLSFARFPLMVGHYEGDTIIGPEAVIDRLFDGALTERYNLGLYPGPVGTFSVVARQPTALQRALQLPNAAIVVGLGRWGELTAGRIANLLRGATLEYLLRMDDPTPDAGDVSTPTGIGLSVLLIGTTASNISTEDSVGAIIRGIAQANREIELIAGLAAPVTDVEILELYVDTAIEAARAAKRLAGTLSDELKITINAEPSLQRGRYGRVRLTATRNFDAWRRWEITAERSTNRKPDMPEPLRAWLRNFAKGPDTDTALLRVLASMALNDGTERPPDRLKFVSLSDRARAEVMMEQHQPSLIDRLVQSANGSTRFDEDASRALFELMVPNDLKDGLGQLSNVVFVLDGHTSSYPWELMTDGGAQPLWTRVRMVRQLQSDTYRMQIRATTAKTAYIVGDPRVAAPFRQLPGAATEAARVRKLLEADGEFQPTSLPAGARANEVLAGLFARPYRILHLAGHGAYQPATDGRPEVSGMVLDGDVLTAAVVRKLPQVPELVFLNCCSIGQVGDTPPAGSATGVAYNHLAASISRELIEMGVRAVVAAGWAVRDDAALLFAEVFYRELLGGDTFGRALTTARKATWQGYPTANTWGAYQAYGDPDFRLKTRRIDREKHDRVAPEELLEQVDMIWRRAKRLEVERSVAEGTTEQDGETTAAYEQLKALVAETPREWLERSDVLVAIGEAYGELAMYGDAIHHLGRALDTGELNSKTTIKAAEQYLNFVARDGARRKNLNDLQDAIKKLESLQGVAPTSERFSLLGGTHKRIANLLTDPADVRSEIGKAAACYEEAHRHNAATARLDHYPIVNWMALEVVRGSVPKEFDILLQQAAVSAEQTFVHDRSAKDAVFAAVAPADIEVVRALASGALGQSGDIRTQTIKRALDLYAEGFRRTQATTRQADSATGQLETLEGLLEKLAGPNPTAETTLTREALRTIRLGLANR